MGWSLPEVPEKEPAPAWSPWVCLLIIILFVGISTAIAVCSFWWETLATRVWNWNEWCLSTRLKWRLRAHQHRVILSHIFVAADTGRQGVHA